MHKISLDAVAREHLEKATTASTGRSATTVYGGHEQLLRHTLVALTAGTWLTLIIPPKRHSLEALEDSAALLTVVK